MSSCRSATRRRYCALAVSSIIGPRSGALDRGSHQLGRRHLDVRPPDQDGQVGHPLGVRCPGRAAGEGDHPERTFASAYDTDDVPYRLLTMLQMVGVLVLAAGVPVAVEHADYRAITVG